MKQLVIISFLVAVAILESCKSSQPLVTSAVPPAIKATAPADLSKYRASSSKLHDLVHTSLKVRPDWAMRRLSGNAEITLHPHFYSSNTLILNARGMLINNVSLLKPSGKSQLVYNHHKDSLEITLDRMYSKNENYTISIDYVARPEELDSIGGSAAISSDKGLYFINADGMEKYKPRELWTQGETQSNSVWFPTIDVPNQKMTQDIAITVDTFFVTLSNGLLIKSTLNADGTRTDFWKQTLPHAPYLAMMAIGNYAVVKDSWNGKEVSYYVEPEYKNVARKIFGNTPEMIDFFSKKLQVPYAWEKYAQVIARDYVSGAMENTSATLHGEFLQQDERELLDYTGEDVIAHELFHHWFGDLVTCESWSNIPLNESFASYGEYLWNEYKYGSDEAELGLQNDLASYLRESKNKQVNLIRFYYNNREDMFDRHSYQKGGCVLHMLRKQIGDEAFFNSLKLYLETNKFKSVEIHNLRLAFEETTGEDLNWFFNQWFLSSGHPDIDITYEWDAAVKKEKVTIQQLQNFDKTPLFKLQIDVDIYNNGSVKRQRIVCDKQLQSFYFSADKKPDVINVDADKMLVCSKKDNHTIDEWIFLYKHGRLYTDRKEALQFLAKDIKSGSASAEIMLSALDDKFWRIRQFALSNLESLTSPAEKELIKSKILAIIKFDRVASVRNTALNLLSSLFPDEDHSKVLKEAIKDSSYAVCIDALTEFTKKNTIEGLAIAKSMEDASNQSLREGISSVYVEYGNDEQAEFMNQAMLRATGYYRYRAVDNYGSFLKRCKNMDVLKQGASTIYDQAKGNGTWLIRMSAVQTLKDLRSDFNEKATSNPDYTILKERIDGYLNDIKATDKDARIKKMIGNN